MGDSDKLGLGLDDIIRLDRGPNSNRRGGRGGNRGFRARGGGARGGGNFSGMKNGFRTRGGAGGMSRGSNTPAGRWKHDLYEDNSNRFRGAQQQRTSGVNSTTKLLIANLDYNVTTNDIQELFEDVGALRAAHVHYDESGRSLGTAEVVFERRVDAVSAQQKYNTLNLDGRPMDIRIVSSVENGQQRQPNRFANANGAGGRGGNRNNQQNGTVGGGNRPRGGKQQQQQQNGGGGNKKENVTAEDLDAQLDAYRAESKQKK